MTTTAQKLAVLPAVTDGWHELLAATYEVQAERCGVLLEALDDRVAFAEQTGDERLVNDTRRYAALVRDRRNDFVTKARELRVIDR